MSGRIRYARGRDIQDNRPELREAENFREFAKAILNDRSTVKGQQWFSAPFNSDGRRCRENAQPRRFLPVDLDKIDPQVHSDLRLWFAKYQGFAYPTASSTPEAPRERMVLELDRDANREECIRIGASLARDLYEEFGDKVEVDGSVFRNEQPVYTPLEGAQPAFFTGDPIPVDQWLETAPAAQKVAAPATALAVEDAIPGGQRDKTLTSWGGTMRRRGMTQGAIEAALLVENQRCTPPLPEADIKRIAASVARYPTLANNVFTASGNNTDVTAPDPAEFANIVTARTVMSTPGGATVYCVEQRIPSGLVLIAGRPKSKKSWLALQIGIAVARDGETLGAKARPGRVLAVLMEDNQIRTRRRLEFFGIDATSAPENLHLEYDWPSGDLGVAKLDRWMQMHPDTAVIVVDVLQRFRGAKDPRQSAYEADYTMLSLLHRLAAKYPGLTVLVVHHTRKGQSDDPMEAISGTFGISGAADAYVVLVRRQDQERWAVHIDGRDWEAWNHDFLWEFRQGTGWHWLGMLDEDLTANQAEIVTIAKQEGSLTPSMVAQHFNITKQSAHQALKQLENKQVLFNAGRGRYKPVQTSMP